MLMIYGTFIYRIWASQVALVVKNSTASSGNIIDGGSIPGSGKIPWRREEKPTPVYFLKNPMDIRSWQAIVHRVTESDMTEVT